MLVAPLPKQGKKTQHEIPSNFAPHGHEKSKLADGLGHKSHMRLKLLYVLLETFRNLLPFSSVVQFHRCHHFLAWYHPPSSSSTHRLQRT